MSVGANVLSMATRRLARTSDAATPLVREDVPQFVATVVEVADLGGGMRRVTCEAPGLRAWQVALLSYSTSSRFLSSLVMITH